MKKLLSICALCAAVFAMASCEMFQGDPEIVITTSNGQITAEAAAGDVTFNYDVVNPRNGATVTLEIPEGNDWITNPVINQDAKSITVTLAENMVKETRNAILTVKYTYGDKNVTTAVSIIQKESLYDHIVTCTYGSVTYFGSQMNYNPELSTSILQISNEPLDDWYENSYYYVIDLCGLVTENLMPAPGTYSYAQEEAEGTFGLTGMGYGEWVGDLDNDDDYKEFIFTDGTVVVEYEGNVCNITATLEDEDGDIHFIEYSGELEFYDQSAYSTLEDDLDLTLEDYGAYLIYYGDGYSMGSNNYTFQFIKDDAMVLVDVCVSPELYLENGFSTITFNVIDQNSTAEDNVFIYGFPSGNTLLGCWYYNQADMSMAPFIDGKITVTDNGDKTYNVSADVIDDRGFNITISGTNLPLIEFIDATQSGASVYKAAESGMRPEFTNLAEKISFRRTRK